MELIVSTHYSKSLIFLILLRVEKAHIISLQSKAHDMIRIKVVDPLTEIQNRSFEAERFITERYQDLPNDRHEKFDPDLLLQCNTEGHCCAGL